MKPHSLIRKGLLGIVFAIPIMLIIAPTAFSDYGTQPFRVEVTVPGSGQGNEGQQAGSSGGCVAGDGSSIPCTDQLGGSWNGNCYESLLADSIDDPMGWYQQQLNHVRKSEGVLLRCVPLGGGVASLLWRATAEPPPSTQELTEAARLVVEGTITAPEIGIYPDDLLEVDPENWGIVGFPTWFWAKNPSPDYTTEKVQTTSVRGHTLRVTAKFNYSHWDPGDGGRAITCDLGTEAIGVDSPQRSPSGCDHIYTKVGVYTVTATWYFTVDWSGAGQEGFFDVSVDRTGTYRVEEVHIVNVPPR